MFHASIFVMLLLINLTFVLAKTSYIDLIRSLTRLRTPPLFIFLDLFGFRFSCWFKMGYMQK